MNVDSSVTSSDKQSGRGRPRSRAQSLVTQVRVRSSSGRIERKPKSKAKTKQTARDCSTDQRTESSDQVPPAQSSGK